MAAPDNGHPHDSQSDGPQPGNAQPGNAQPDEGQHEQGQPDARATSGATSRRALFGYLGTAAAGAAVGAVAGVGADRALASDAPTLQPPGATIGPYGRHQPGVAQHTPASVEVLALTLLPKVVGDRDALAKLLRVWSADIEALTQGRGSPGDTTRYLAQTNGDLTITVGLGGQALTGLPTPAGYLPIPAFTHDRLQPRWNGGDLLLIVAGRDATTTGHAVRRLLVDAGPWATPSWRQQGSWNGIAADGRPQTGRNHFGQVDGSANPAPGTELFEKTVWITEGPWAGGTTVAVRRIRMDLVEWDEQTPAEQEASIGRRLDDGAPLSGGTEASDFDFDATDSAGNRRIAIRAHGRRSHHSLNGGARIFRKGLNYVTGETATPAGARNTGAETPWALETGLVFMSFQQNLDGQFVRIQESLDLADDLNEWTTTIGSAEFCILPGFARGEWLGQRLLT